MQYFAPAKLNLNLRIVGRRTDGFHYLQSLISFLNLADEIRITPAEKLTLNIEGFFGGLIQTQDNLIVKAARMLDEHRGAHITLKKEIPVGAGLGGGSADAACVLKALNEFWELQKSEEELLRIARSLGSDVPACLHAKPVWVEGVGDALTPVSFLPSWHIVLVYPHLLLTAKVVYERTTPPYSAIQTMPAYSNAEAWRQYFAHEQNDLTHAATSIHPEISDILDVMETLPNLLFARMSGSGSTCFAAFENAAHAEQAKAELQEIFPDYWVADTTLLL